MSIVIYRQPTAYKSEVVGGMQKGEYSTLLAAHNPILHLGRRYDGIATYIQDNGSGYVQLFINGMTLTPTVGMQVYCDCPNYFLDGVHIITAVIGTAIDLDVPMVGGAQSLNFYIVLPNCTTNYSVRVSAYKGLADGSDVLLGSMQIVPFKNGTFQFDLSPYAKLCVGDIYADWWRFVAFYTLIGNAPVHTFHDRRGTGKITCLVEEVYDELDPDHLPDPYGLSYYLANASMQPTHANGVNMTECYQSAGTPHFLSKFYKSPCAIRYWDCMELQLSNKEIPLLPLLTFHANGLDSTQLDACFKIIKNKIVVHTVYKQLASTAYNTGFGIDPPSPPGYFGWFLIGGLPKSDLLYWGFSPDYYTVQIVDRATHQIQYTEEQVIRYSCTPRNPVVLMALNHYGGWSSFAFGGNVASAVQTKQGSEFSPYNQDPTSLTIQNLLLGKTATIDLTVGADDLDDDDMVLIQDILTSPVVKAWLPTADSVTPSEYWNNTAVNQSNMLARTFFDVKIEQGTYALVNSKSNKHKAEFKIKLMEMNIQSR